MAENMGSGQKKVLEKVGTIGTCAETLENKGFRASSLLIKV